MADDRTHKVLFLDDRSKRLHAALEKYKNSDLTLVCTVQECIKMISENEWDIISLDHDLGFEEYTNSLLPGSGMEIVRWMERNARWCRQHLHKTMIIVHSSNEPAGVQMVDRISTIFREEGYWRTTYERFEYD